MKSNSVKYCMRSFALGVDCEIALTKSRYDELSNAIDSLFEVLAIEEKFCFVMQNYLELERKFHDYALSNMVSFQVSWTSGIDEIHNLNRMLSNLLSTCRMYVDHVPKNLSSLYGKGSEECKIFVDEVTKVYDSSLGYRVMCALRNYVQHQGLPLRSIAKGSEWNDQMNPKNLVETIDAFISVSHLEKERGFKKCVLDELKKGEDDIGIKWVFRENQSMLVHLHKKVREIIKERVGRWDSLVLESLKKFEKKYPKCTGIYLVSCDDQESIIEEKAIIRDMIERRNSLQKRHKLHLSFGKAFVSGEVRQQHPNLN